MNRRHLWGLLLLLLPVILCLCSCQQQTAAGVLPTAAAALLTDEDAPQAETAEPPAMAEDGVHPQLIAHAGGAIYGYRLTNSLEALDNAYAEGFRFIEMDLNLTSDGQFALIHDWDSTAQRLLGQAGVLSAEELHNADVMAGLTLLTMDELLVWLDEHPDCTIITDIKEEDNAPLLRQLAEETGEQQDRFIPQAYSFEEYDQIKALGYDEVILTLYRMAASPSALIDFAAENDPWAIAMSEERLTEGLIPQLAAEGIAVYAHAVNSVDTVDKWHDLGLTGIYTDYFTPSHWLY